MKPPMNLPLFFDGRHYDQRWRHLTVDIPFWISQAKRYGGPILELTCGTGRVSIPLAEAGYGVTGIDISDSMLDEARRKSAATGLQVEWAKGDIRDFDLGRKFPLVIFPFNSIVALLDVEDFEACLACVRVHLARRAGFVIDVFNPSLDFLHRDPEKRFPHCEYPDPDGRGTINVTESNVYDSAHQINLIKLFFKFPGREEEILEELNLRMYFPQELDALLKYNGFRIEAKYGNYDEKAFDTGAERQLIVCSARD